MGNERAKLWDVWAGLQLEIVDLSRILYMVEKDFPEEAKAAGPAIEKILACKRDEADRVKAAMVEMGGGLI